MKSAKKKTTFIILSVEHILVIITIFFLGQIEKKEE